MGGLRHSSINISPASHANSATFDNGGYPRCLGLGYLRSHVLDHWFNFGLGITRRIPSPKIDKDVFMRQNQTQFSRTFQAEGGSNSRHNTFPEQISTIGQSGSPPDACLISTCQVASSP